MKPRTWSRSALAAFCLIAGPLRAQVAGPPGRRAVEVTETDRSIRIASPTLEASVRKRDYVIRNP